MSLFFCFKQKTAYEMRISDWSSDVCSSDLIEQTLHQRGGNVIIPAFAVGRTQQIIYQIHQLARQGRLEHPKVFVDSPMATEVTRITRQHLRRFDEQAGALEDGHARGRGSPWPHSTPRAEEPMDVHNTHPVP